MKRISRIFGRAAEIALIVVFAAVLCLLVYVGWCSHSGRAATVFGTTVLKVVTPSMEPEISAGDHILVHRTPPEELNVGDVITFYSEDKAIYGRINTHRIVGIEPDGSFVTMGDSNPTADPVTVSPDRIIGRYVKKLSFMSVLSGKTVLAVVIAVVSVIMVCEAMTVFRWLNKDEECEDK